MHGSLTSVDHYQPLSTIGKNFRTKLKIKKILANVQDRKIYNFIAGKQRKTLKKHIEKTKKFSLRKRQTLLREN